MEFKKHLLAQQLIQVKITILILDYNDKLCIEIGRDNYGGGEGYYDGYLAEMALLMVHN